jgi:pre-mRNA-splicing factor ATP-dependent RNA helicase DHX38/PRP16
MVGGGGGDGSDGEDGGGGGGRGGKSTFKTHMKKNQANSEFSRTKTMAQQRRSLPVYGVKEDLMQASDLVCLYVWWQDER